MMTNEMHHTRPAIIMTLSLSLPIFLRAVIFLSSIENNNGSIIYAHFQNNNSNLSLGVNITSQVSVIVNDVKPYQPATSNGNIGAKNDYSIWFFILGSNYTSINEGTNEIIAKLSCLTNSLNINNNAKKWYSINVTGVTTTNNITVPTQSSPVINSSTQNEPNNDESQNPDEEQKEPLFDTTDKNAENVMKEEIMNFRERIILLIVS